MGTYFVGTLFRTIFAYFCIFWLEEQWIDFKKFFIDTFYRAVYGLARVLNDAWAGIQVAWVETVSFLGTAWTPRRERWSLWLTNGNLVFHSCHLAHQGSGLWEGTARYGKREPKEPGQSSFSFDTGGGTTHITQSLQTVAKYPADAADFKGAIGGHNDSVEGTDVTIPVYNFKETHYTPRFWSPPPTRQPSSASPASSTPRRSKASPRGEVCSSSSPPAPSAVPKIRSSFSASRPVRMPSA